MRIARQGVGERAPFGGETALRGRGGAGSAGRAHPRDGSDPTVGDDGNSRALFRRPSSNGRRGTAASGSPVISLQRRKTFGTPDEQAGGDAPPDGLDRRRPRRPLGGMRGSCGRSCSRKAADAAARRPVARLRRSLRGCGSRGRRPETGGSSAGCGGVEETPAHPGGSRPAATALGSGRCVAPPRCGPGDGCASSGARRRAARTTRAFGT